MSLISRVRDAFSGLMSRPHSDTLPAQGLGGTAAGGGWVNGNTGQGGERDPAMGAT